MNGEAVYRFVPQGNHTIQIFWRSVKVYDGWVWVGYHPTIYPWMTRPAVEYTLILPVGDLIVKAVDTGGNILPASFTVLGPTLETTFENMYSQTGILNISQLPIAEYKVSAESIIEAFNKTVDVVGVFKPGEESYLVLPVHSIRVIVKDSYGKSLRGAYVKLGPLSGESGEDGSVIFSGVPQGVYELEVDWLKIPVYSKKINISEPIVLEARTNVYDISLTFVDREGDRIYADYVFIDPSGRVFRGEFRDGFKIMDIPDGLCNITVLDHDSGKILYKSLTQTYKLAESGKLVLMVEDMVFRVEFLGGRPLEKARIIIVDLETGQRLETYTGRDGRAVLEKARYSNYKIIVYYPYTGIPIYSSETGFTGQEIYVRVREAVVTVRVIDLLGKPVEGAETSIYYMETPLGKGYTDSTGKAEFVILERPQYRIVVKHGSSQETIIAEPNKNVEVKIGEANIMGVKLDIGEIMSILYTILPIIVTVICVVIVFKLVSKLVKARWGE